MCKLLIFTRAPLQDKPAEQRDFFDKMLRKLASSEFDGLGIAWVDGEGKMHRRRWALSSDFKGIHVDDLRADFCHISSDPVDDTVAVGPVIIHGRMATSKKCLENSHPHTAMNADGVEYALIHNGVVHVDHDKLKEIGVPKTTCDSEHIINAWVSGGMEKVTELIMGYYAFGLITTNPDLGIKGSRLHVVKDNVASLYSGSMPTGDFVFATTPNLLTEAGCREWARVQDLIHIEFDHEGGLLELEDIKKAQSWPSVGCGYEGFRGYYAGLEDSDRPYQAGSVAAKAEARMKKKKEKEKSHGGGDQTGGSSECDDNVLNMALEELDKRIAKAEARAQRLKILREKKIGKNIGTVVDVDSDEEVHQAALLAQGEIAVPRDVGVCKLESVPSYD